MSQLFEVKEVDRTFYRDKLQNFLPERIIDVHTHVWQGMKPSSVEKK